LALVWLAAGATACLPRGDAPAGRQVGTGRVRSLAGALPARSPDDGVLRLLVSQPGDPSYATVDLYLLEVPDTGATTEKLLVENWGGGFCGAGFCVDTDSRGRLFVWSNVGAASSGQEALTRIDLDTGDRLELGVATGVAFSQSRTRVLVSRSYPASYDLLEADDTITEVPFGQAYFVGDDLYFIDDATQTLGRSRAGGAPEAIRTAVQTFSALYTVDGLRLLIYGAVDNPAGPKPLSVLDPATRAEQPLPFDSSRLHGLSPDAAWALLIPAGEQFPGRDFSLFELATGHEDPFQIPFRLGQTFWRPGHTEVWLVSVDYQAGYIATSIKVPDQPLGEAPAAAVTFGGGLPSVFTSDGRHWFSDDRRVVGDATILVGDADDVSAPRFPVNPEGSTTFGGREVPDGRLIVEAYYDSPNRSDLHLVDPNDGTTRVLGREGGLLASGARRVLAILHVVNGCGDLTAIDLDDERSTALAVEFALTAYVQPPAAGARPVEPGARLAFQFRARFDSPYDGIWVTTLP
jgi:hypothetical protein